MKRLPLMLLVIAAVFVGMLTGCSKEETTTATTGGKPVAPSEKGTPAPTQLQMNPDYKGGPVVGSKVK